MNDPTAAKLHDSLTSSQLMAHPPGSFSKQFAWLRHGTGLSRLHGVIRQGFKHEPVMVDRSDWRKNSGINDSSIDLIPLNFFLHNTILDRANFVSVDELVLQALVHDHSPNFDRLALFALNLSMAGLRRATTGTPLPISHSRLRRDARPAMWANEFVREFLWKDGAWRASSLKIAEMDNFFDGHIDATKPVRTKVRANYRNLFELCRYLPADAAEIDSGAAEWGPAAHFLAWDRLMLDGELLDTAGSDQLLEKATEHQLFKLLGISEEAGDRLAANAARQYLDAGGLERLRASAKPKLDELTESAQDSMLAELPEQGHGPHFRIDANAILCFDAPPVLDPSGNKISRLESLQPLIITLCQQLLATLGINEQPRLRSVAEDYFKAVNKPIEEIDFARLYGLGLRLEYSLTAAKRELSDRISPSLEDGAAEALDSLLALHGPFILSTVIGNELLADAERFDRSTEDDIRSRKAALTIGLELERDRSIAAPEVGRFVKEVAEISQREGSEVRSTSYSAATMKNLCIVMIAGATLAAFPVAGGVLYGAPGVFFGGAISLLGNDGVKNSRPFKLISGRITDAIDHVATVDAIDLARKLAPLKNFAIRNETALRQLAGDNVGMKWIGRYLDWIKAQ
jgi:hypothetical protein